MSELLSFARLKMLLATCTVKQFLSGSRLRVAVVGGAAVIFWWLMFGMFWDVFRFLEKFGLTQILSDYLFAFFYLALLVMMAISNGIISYTAFFRNDEAKFLMSLPVRPQNVFAYKGVESVLFSAWGMVTLVVPMCLAYGITQHSPWYFYLFAFAFAFLFMCLPMQLGALAALVLPLILPRRRSVILVLLGAIGLGLIFIWGMSLLGQRPSAMLTDAGLKRILDRIGFCQHWALPSAWVSEGMLLAARGNAQRAGFLALLLLSNVLFLGMAATWLGKRLYLRSWAMAAGGSRSRRPIKADSIVDKVLSICLFFLPARLKLLVLKDAKIFRRDPAQWSQCLLFFGLLTLYVINLPRFGFTELQPFWHSLVSLLNLGATCLTLSTLTSRFIFPQLSLEGRRIWVLGLAPMRRRTILWGKFVFATVGSFVISGALIALSDMMLGLGGGILTIHLLVVLCACCGLNGLAVGLGAVYPNMRSDNPSQIVSSFGGTFNLICSIGFILACITLVAVPLHAHATGRIEGQRFVNLTVTCIGLEVILTLVVCLVPMFAGIRAFKRMEF